MKKLVIVLALLMSLSGFTGEVVGITGTVTDSEGNPISLAKIEAMGTNLSKHTQPDGSYALLVDIGWSGTVIASHPTYNLDPSSRYYDSIVDPIYNQDYIAETSHTYNIILPDTILSNNTSEDGNTGYFTIKLSKEPTAPVTIPMTSSDTTEGTLSDDTVILDSTNWYEGRQVTVTGVDDQILDEFYVTEYYISFGNLISNDPDYNDLVISETVSCGNEDNERMLLNHILITKDNLEVGEGTITQPPVKISLSSQPIGQVTVKVVRVSGSTNIRIVGTSEFTFNSVNWNIPKDIPFEAIEDGDTVNSNATFTCSSNGYPSVNINVTEVDLINPPINDDDDDDYFGGCTVGSTSNVENIYMILTVMCVVVAFRFKKQYA